MRSSTPGSARADRAEPRAPGRVGGQRRATSRSGRSLRRSGGRPRGRTRRCRGRAARCRTPDGAARRAPRAPFRTPAGRRSAPCSRRAAAWPAPPVRRARAAARASALEEPPPRRPSRLRPSEDPRLQLLADARHARHEGRADAAQVACDGVEGSRRTRRSRRPEVDVDDHALERVAERQERQRDVVVREQEARTAPSMFETMLRCVSITPLGSPVVPDV